MIFIIKNSKTRNPPIFNKYNPPLPPIKKSQLPILFQSTKLVINFSVHFNFNPSSAYFAIFWSSILYRLKFGKLSWQVCRFADWHSVSINTFPRLLVSLLCSIGRLCSTFLLWFTIFTFWQFWTFTIRLLTLTRCLLFAWSFCLFSLFLWLFRPSTNAVPHTSRFF